MSHPEIEAGLTSPEYFERRAALESATTSVDVLDIPLDCAAQALLRENLNHDKLVDHCNKSNPPLALRALFLNVDRDFKRADFYTLRVRPATLDWLQTFYNVSPHFVEAVINISKWAKIGHVCYHTRDQNERTVKIEGLYRMGSVGGATHVWFKYDIDARMATYVISNCPPPAKKTLFERAQRHMQQFQRPFILDGFMADACTASLKNEVERPRVTLLAYERFGASKEVSAEILTESFQALHRLSRTWYIVHEDFIDLEEALLFLTDVSKTHSQALKQSWQTVSYESMQFLISQIQTWKRWTENYNARTKVRIDLFFNLANQIDNRTNLDIASTSKSIAVSTLRDSSAMTTIAGLTMLFLPGTFVSAIFSMVFFNPASNNSDLELLPCWWYFPAISIPLTVAVFIVWLVWHRIRVAKAEAILARSINTRPFRWWPPYWIRGKFAKESLDPVLLLTENIVVANKKDLEFQGRHL